MTLGAKLLENEEKRRLAAREARGKALIDFFKVTCRKEVEEAIAKNRPPQWLTPPPSIRHLFAGRLSHNDLLDHERPNSEYAVEWAEIKTWAKSEGLEVVTGYSEQRPGNPVKPWAEYNWMGRLQPIQPSPPSDIVVYRQKGFWVIILDAIFGKK